MHCQNCGQKVEANSKFCSNCGCQIKNNVNNNKVTKEHFNIEKAQTNTDNFDERFIKSYMGKNADQIYEKIMNGGINIWAILFGISYFVYRKMYFVSGILLLIVSIVIFGIPYTLSYVLLLIGLMFYSLYKWDITRKLRKIKKENKDKNEQQLIEIAKSKGGTSILGVIVFLIIYIIIFVLFWRN